MTFYQEPPRYPDPFATDVVLQEYLARVLPEDVRGAVFPELADLGALAASTLWPRYDAHRDATPVLEPWDAWGRRIDRITLTPVWQQMERLAAERGLVATAYERRHGAFSRIHQFALAYLAEPASGVYMCPLAMTDGAAAALLASRNEDLIHRAVPRLTSRDPAKFWTSGQWMTERTGGSDVAITQTVARADGDAYRLYGTKWFSSATTSQMALTLARPEGNPQGGPGLALFYLETRDEQGALNGILVNRLKDKLGTRMVPTAELTLEGARAFPVMGLTDGIRHVTPMLTITRIWNAVGAIAGMRAGLSLARDYARRRVAFGAALVDKPLHMDTLADLEAEAQAAFFLAFRAIELLGRSEAGELDAEGHTLLRLLTPLVKLTTAKQSVLVASEVLEAFGGAGYIEDTGLPRLLRDAQVLPIWEGTTNVLALDVLRAIAQGAALDVITREVTRAAGSSPERATGAAKIAHDAILHARAWFAANSTQLEAGARRFALTLGRAVELALLVEHARWAATRPNAARAHAVAARFARRGVALIADDVDESEARAILIDR